MPAVWFSLILERHSNKQTLIPNTDLSQCANHPFIYIYQTQIYRHGLHISTIQHIGGPPSFRLRVGVGRSPMSEHGAKQHLRTTSLWPFPSCQLYYIVSWRLQQVLYQKNVAWSIFQKDPIILPHCLLLHEYHTHLHIASSPIEIQTVNHGLWHSSQLFTCMNCLLTLHPTLQTFHEINTPGINRHPTVYHNGKPKAHEARPPICSLSPLLWSLACHPLRHQNWSPHLRRNPSVTSESNSSHPNVVFLRVAWLFLYPHVPLRDGSMPYYPLSSLIYRPLVWYTIPGLWLSRFHSKKGESQNYGSILSRFAVLCLVSWVVPIFPGICGSAVWPRG